MTQAMRLIICSVFPLLFCLSCVRFVGPEDVRQDLSTQTGVKLRQHVGFTVTRSGIWLARKFVDDDDVPLKGVRRVEIGVYEVKGLRKGYDSPAALDMSYFTDWERLVRVHEDDEEVLVLTRQRDDLIHSMLIVVVEDDEWILVRLRGKLNHVLEQALEMAFDDVHRPDLYAATRRERGLDPSSPETPAPVAFGPARTLPGDFGTCLRAQAVD